MKTNNTIAPGKPLTAALLRNIDGYWRTANYLSVGQIYLYDNPLLNKPLKLAHIEPRPLGHWGTTPGLNFVGRFTRIAGRFSGPMASGQKYTP